MKTGKTVFNKPFRVVKHVHQALPNEVVKYCEKYLDALNHLTTLKVGEEKKHWIEGKINGGWYGLA